MRSQGHWPEIATQKGGFFHIDAEERGIVEKIRRAEPEEFDVVWGLYADVCAQMPRDRYTPGWVLGVYPSEADVRDAIEAGALWLGFSSGEAVAAMVLTPADDPEYADVPWPSGAEGNDVACVHLLAVCSSARGTGVGDDMVKAAIDISRSWHKRAIHLDVMPGNLAARRLYERAGFVFTGEYEVFYEDTGAVNVEMFELEL